jgi:formamidopyrimidine-DNA glycosylase
MPEGDTLRRLAGKIDARFAGQIVRRCAFRDPRLAGRDLTGDRLLGADAYGKHLFVRFAPDGAVGQRSLHAHLLMTGSFEIGPASREAEPKRRVELWLDDGRLTGVSVPLLGLIATADEHSITDELGPDLCAVDGAPDPSQIVARTLRRTPDAPLSAAMLDQRNVAGFGNLYANDVPFVVGVSPFQPVAAITGLADVVAIGTALIRVNARRGPQNTTGRRLDTAANWVHGLGRRPCPVCGTRLDYLDADRSPWQRSVTWCPSCQPAPNGVTATADLARARRLVALHPAVKEPYFPD